MDWCEPVLTLCLFFLCTNPPVLETMLGVEWQAGVILGVMKRADLRGRSQFHDWTCRLTECLLMTDKWFISVGRVWISWPRTHKISWLINQLHIPFSELWHKYEYIISISSSNILGILFNTPNLQNIHGQNLVFGETVCRFWKIKSIGILLAVFVEVWLCCFKFLFLWNLTQYNHEYVLFYCHHSLNSAFSSFTSIYGIY